CSLCLHNGNHMLVFLLQCATRGLSLTSPSCGDGVQRREVFCQVGDRRSPAETGCVQRSRPASSQSCRVADCPSRYRWREGDWQAVSRSGCQYVLNHKVYKPKQVVSPFCLTWTDVLRHLW
ncbi:hypothetical protein GOODEAATRI_018326, partial [Goodea atripinnis]